MTQKTSKNQPSRYENVKKILNDAQGKSHPDYQGWGAFWNLPLEEFVTVELYGQRMIAPPHDTDGESNSSAGGCSHCGSEGTSEPDCWPSTGAGGHTDHNSSRSEQSGLIIGLRGQAPFDGSAFPKLLWDAEYEVSSANINTIAEWIDAGCPETDHVQTDDIQQDGQQAHKPVVGADDRAKIRALAQGHERHVTSEKHPNQIRKQVDGLHVRKEISSMSQDELALLGEAIVCMNQYNDYYQDERSWNFWGRIHAANCQHGWEQFLPWHRAYLYHFEQQLQDYDANITLSYWDWAAYAPQNTDTNTKKLDTGVIPAAYRCWITQEAIERLSEKSIINTKERKSLQAIVGKRYNSGQRFLEAATIKYELEPLPNPLPQPSSLLDYQYSPKIKAIYNELWRINPLWYRNRWPGSMGRPYDYPMPEDIEKTLNIRDFHEFGSGPASNHYFGVLENIHNRMHNFSGGMNPKYPATDGKGKRKQTNDQSLDNPQVGAMVDPRVTAFDPIFWGHHSNVDRLWAAWQKRNPGSNPDGLGEVMPPWNFTVSDVLKTHELGYEYVKDTHFYPTNNEVPITRFNSQAAGVRSSVLATFKKAEVRLHRVQKARYNGVIRVFINDDQADVHTPTDGNEHFAGEFVTFGGTCIGGPRHCDVPFPRARRFDRRPLHHNEPRNIRIDVTEAVRRVIAKQETDISVHLVVMDLDGTPRDGALFIDGVSLTFMD